MRLPRPPLAIAVPALGFLLLETLRCAADLSLAAGLRLIIVACWVVAILHERPAALTLWMLYCGFLALQWCSQALGLGRTSPAIASVHAALAAFALANAGYLFFFHRDAAPAKDADD